MMYITVGSHEYVWHVGSPMPKEIAARMEFVNSVQADGDELAAVMAQFTNLPRAPGHRVVSWFGDHAKFIVANVRL